MLSGLGVCGDKSVMDFHSKEYFRIGQAEVDESGPDCGGQSCLNHLRKGKNNLDTDSSTARGLHAIIERHRGPVAPLVQLLENVVGSRNKSMIEGLVDIACLVAN